jgi:hypothetical protein
MTKGGIVYSLALMPLMTFGYSRLPGCTAFGCAHRSESVTALPGDITPSIKPVSSKLYVSSSSALYLAFILITRLN